MQTPFQFAISKAFQRLRCIAYCQDMALLKIESVALGVNSASQERAHTEVSVNVLLKTAVFLLC